MLLRELGFAGYSQDAVIWFLGLTAMLSLVSAWIVDSIMRDLAFGVLGNSVLLAGGALGGLVLWHRFHMSIRQTDPLTILLVCLAAGFGLVLALAATRRTLT